MPPEGLKPPLSPESELDTWLKEITNRWQAIPQFQADPEKLQHLVIICDGNRRAAQERMLPLEFGHLAGTEVIRGISRACRGWEIRDVTFWTWSTENWQRDAEQVEFVMNLAARLLSDPKLLEEFNHHNVRFTHLGRKDRLPPPVSRVISNLERQTATSDGYRINLAMDYGGLDEVARGVGKIIEAVQTGSLNPEMIKVNPQVILGFLDTANQVLPDLVIRTGVKKGEVLHTSGLMPLQTAYSGWVFLADLFPDLTPDSLLSPIQDFLEYERRFGR